jgi:putative endonuclease
MLHHTFYLHQSRNQNEIFYFDKDMAQHIDLGKQGEKLAERHLVTHPYSIPHRNWQYSYYEPDSIALKNDVVRFVAVKLRSFKSFDFPEEQVSIKKFRDLTQAAEEFLFTPIQPYPV